MGNEQDALRVLAAGRLEGLALEFVLDGEDLDAGSAMVGDGDKDVMAVGGPDGLHGMAVGREGA